MSYQAMERHGGILNAYDQVKEPVLTRMHIGSKLVDYMLNFEGKEFF